MLQSATHNAIAKDRDAVERGEPPPCMSSETKDCRDHAKGVEDEMAKRTVAFIPVRFLDED
jgi:hypothetical protein